MQLSQSFQVYNASAGSGKTFSLVKEYLKILLTSSNPFKFQQILAVTFTNKAAGEMKQRVIESLHSFSKEEVGNMFHAICDETKLSEKTIFKKSKIILNAILQNYSAFSITTIDSFTHKLIRTFAHDLQLPLNFEVEMDAETLLNESVDLVISKIGENKALTDLLINYAIQKLDDDKAWDISNELKDFAKLILNENHAKYLKTLQTISIEDFKLLKETLQKENTLLEKQLKEVGDAGINLINNAGIDFKDFYYTQLPKHFIALSENPKKAKFFDQNTLKRNIDDHLFYSKSKSDSVKNTIESLLPELLNLYNQSEAFYQQKTLNDLVLNSIIPLAVLNFINTALQEIKSDNNILLNAEFNELISETIKNEPAPFIYERIGEKYKYYFIDEMQDTSELQWQNIIPLIENAVTSENELGEIGKLLLVGDAKQSIYRWRGGKAEQFIDLSTEGKMPSNNPFSIEKSISNLDTNYRSYSEIINFNNQFFKHISGFLANTSYCNLYFKGNNQNINTNIGGFVQISFVDKQQENDDDDPSLIYPKKILDIINNLDTSFEKNDVCVLVRTRKQGVEVAKYLAENGIEIISSETLLINNSEKVQFIINLLLVIQNPLNKEFKVKVLYFLYNFLQIETPKHQFISKLINLSQNNFFEELKQFKVFFNLLEFVQSPFYESIEYIIRGFGLAKQSDSYLQFFLDAVFEYQQKKEMTIQGFLDYWDLKKDKLSIVAPEAKNAIRIMTIHKAKGLEFPVVIFPYNLNIYNQIKPKTWYNYSQSNTIKNVLIDYGKKLNYVGEQGVSLFNNQREQLELDNFNILYVALTRAVEQLYVITEKNITAKNEENLNFTSGLFINFLKQQNLWESEKNDYSFGTSNKVSANLKEANKTVFQTNFISNSWKNNNISIVTSSSLLWDTVQGKSINYGNLIHEILSKIKTKNDVNDVLNSYTFEGVITTDEKTSIVQIINQIVNHEYLKGYFNQNNEVFLEQEIITKDKKIIIPDRIVIINNKATIIDYKTGKADPKYYNQINNYAQVLEQLNFKIDKKLLVYINEEIIVEEV
ncbi:UvrD-helicase domain-containing protein [Lutibacter maritimus]|uniref:DNA 3'-5' helicase n=1 Tax=Lutibacter maritimus TaxID=593133 RepID=A0A1I6PNM4_9FLAO|nr:UvrD-helicase domain-containing protein [Lutibacter maritimus]SFS41801.1 ATP-dependent exoDNAse (exonuclease V) beta subunit (contains helicase and exonuclease domains) [Lutibacter maritimus]